MLTKEEVMHVADLARIALTEEDIKKFQVELKKLLDDVPETIRAYSALSLAEIDPKDLAFIRGSFGKNNYERSMLIKDKLKMSFRESNKSIYYKSTKF